MSGISTPSLKALLAITSLKTVSCLRNSSGISSLIAGVEAPVNNVTSHNCRIFRRPGGSVIFGKVYLHIHVITDKNITALGIFVRAKISSSGNVVDNCSIGSGGLTTYLCLTCLCLGRLSWDHP